MFGRLKILTLAAALFYPAITFAQYNPNVQQGMMDYTAVQPAGFNSSPAGYNSNPDCPPGHYSQSNYPSPAYDYIEERSLNTGEEYEVGPLDRFLSDITRNSWIKTEYLLWKITSPNTNKMLGAPLEGIDDPREGFTIENNNFILFPRDVNVVVPKMPSMNLNDNNGLRLTYGVPLTFGTVEVNGFVLNQASDDNSLNPTEDLFEPNVLATSYTTDGNLNTPPAGLLFHDTAYKVSFSSSIWGAESNLVLDTSLPGEGLKLDPLFGFRYLSIDEKFKQFGQYDDNQLLGIAAAQTLLRSKTDNNIYGGTAGLRIRFVHRWFSLGVEPKITLGANRYKNTIFSTGFVDDGNTFTEKETTFSAIGELNLNAKIHLHENVSFLIGWTGMSTHNVSRPDENIEYSEIDGVIAGRLASDSDLKTVLTYGLTAGGEIRF